MVCPINFVVHQTHYQKSIVEHMQSKITDPNVLVEDEYLNAKELMELHNILIDQREELMTSTMKKVDELT